MKKLFTLALVLLVTVAGYSQVKNLSYKDVKQSSATMQVSKGFESFDNVQGEPNMLRTDGELDYSTYDWQTNCGIINRTIVWPDGKVNFAYTIASDASFTDRGTGLAILVTFRQPTVETCYFFANPREKFANLEAFSVKAPIGPESGPVLDLEYTILPFDQVPWK